MFICFDTEDNSQELMEAGLSGFDKQVTQIAAMTREGKRYYNRGNVPDFLRWLEQQQEQYVYANNIQYDLGNLFGDKLDCLDVTLVGGRVISARWKKKVFLDVFNIWFSSVKALGQAFGLEKLETKSMATDKEYAFRDVEIIHAAMCFAWDFALGIGLDKLPNTAGGVCFAAWKHLGGSNCHDSLELSREAYYGGRVELFKRVSDTGFICYTDVNSLYPSALLGDYPGPLQDCGNELAPHGVAKVTIRVPRCELAVLPWRDPIGRIRYPWGTITGTWALPEIREALASGGKLLKVWQCFGTDQTSQPYRDIMQRFYAARLQAQSGAQREFFKRMMNAFYGRLGTSGVIGRTVWRNEKTEKDGKAFGQKVLVNYHMPLSEETNWGHAAYVTCYGRLALLRYLRLIGAQNLIYCDTDSAIFDVPHPIFNLQFSQVPQPGVVTCNRLSIPFDTGRDLGQMKLESWHTGAETWAPKMYRVDRKYKAKGVPQRLARKFIETGKAEFDLPFKYREAVAFFDRDNARQLSVWRKVSKEVVTTYDRKKSVGNRFFPCQARQTLPK